MKGSYIKISCFLFLFYFSAFLSFSQSKDSIDVQIPVKKTTSSISSSRSDTNKNTSKKTVSAKKRAAAKKKQLANKKKKKKSAKQLSSLKSKTAKKKKGTAGKMYQRGKKTSSKSKFKENSQYSDKPIDQYQMHHLSFHGGVGYSALFNAYHAPQFIKMVGGIGGMLGFGYEWHYKKFMLALTPEFRILSSTDKIYFESPFQYFGSDPNSSFVLPGQIKYYESKKFKEKQTFGQLMLPVLFGMQWEKFYFMAGAKLGYTLFSNFHQKADIYTTLEDKEAMDVWEHIRDLGTLKYANKGKFNMKFDVALSAEFGLNINPFLSPEWNEKNENSKYSWRFRASVFVDYGLPVIGMEHDKEMVSVDEQNLSSYSVHHSNGVSSKLSSFLLGVKLTALMQLNKTKLPPPQNPYIVLQILDGKTNTPFATKKSDVKPTILIENAATKRKISRTPNPNGFMALRTTPGDYLVTISKEGYLPIEPLKLSLFEGINSNLNEKIDTTFVYLYPEPVLSFSILENKENTLISGTYTISDETNEIVAKGKVSKDDQPFTIKLPYNHSYSIRLESNGFIANSFIIGKLDSNDIVKTFELSPIEQGTKFVMHNLFFATNQTTILPQSEKALFDLYDMLRKNPKVRILVTGHTDWIGSEHDNQILSEGRANSVKQSMVQRGIDPSRIEIKGMGESQPIDTNETEEGRQNNRRVEITIL